MKYAKFEWDDINIDHIARHDVEADEAEATLDNNPMVLRTSDNKYLAYGQSDEGRFLLVVFIRKPGQIVRVITARDLTNEEKKQYRRRRR